MVTPRTMRWLCGAAVGVVWLAPHAQAATVCPSGVTAPDVITLTVSPLHPTYQSIVLAPDCDVETISVVRDFLEIGDKDIERVASIPSSTPALSMTGNPLSLGADFSNATSMYSLILKTFSAKLLENIKLPTGQWFNQITLIDSPFTALDGVVFPDQLQTLQIEQTKLKSLKNAKLPDSLKYLTIINSKLSSVDLTYPASLDTLSITKSSMAKIQKVKFADSILTLDFTGNNISVVKGVTWPGSIQNLRLGGNPITNFEIRKSDVEILELLTDFVGDFSQVKCTDASGTIQPVKSNNVCVISDERFEALYGSSSPTTSPSPGSSKKPSTGTGSDTEGSQTEEEDGESSSTETTEPTGSTNNGGTKRNSTTSATGSSFEETVNGSSSSTPSSKKSNSSSTGSQASSTTIVVTTESSSNGTITTVFIVLSIVFALVLALVIYRTCIIKKRKREEGIETSKYSRVDTPGNDTGEGSSAFTSNAPSQEFLANDVRNDKALLAFRIEQNDIKVNTQIARGGYGVIYQAVYQGKPVALKQMLPGSWQDDRVLASFMDEIRMCASLDHPKIVTFVGIAYSSLRDLSVVIEFMPGGDLYVLLHKQQPSTSGKDWTQPWTSSQIKCKASIGQDVAEALAYLHSLETPILHRDLKAKNVLLDAEGGAKLSDFGISRELVVDQTMTSEVGTSAWIAPEVLRGARYSEKADIYSLGVLLVEMDRCRHPYADEPALQLVGAHRESVGTKASTMSHVAYKNTQIAVLVSTGKLRPSATSMCPAEVASLAAQCVSFDPSERPTAEEVATALRQIAGSAM